MESLGTGGKEAFLLPVPVVPRAFFKGKNRVGGKC